MQAKRAHTGHDRRLRRWLTSAEFERWVRRSLAEGRNRIGGGHQGVVLRCRERDFDLAIKCVTGYRWLRRLRGWMLFREYRVYRRLAGIRGIARCHGMPLPGVLALEYIPGSGYRHAVIENRERWFDELEQLVRTMHGRGVSHGDLKRKANLLAGADGRPYVLDFGTAVYEKPHWHVINNWWFRQQCRTDINAIIKHKYHGRYEAVAGRDRAKLRTTFGERLWRGLRHWLGLQH